MGARGLGLAGWLGAALAVAGAADGQVPPADQVSVGKALARQICASCHIVAPDQTTVTRSRDQAPNFVIVAKRPDVTAQSLRQFLSTTHTTISTPGTMPDPQLTDDQKTVLVAYILSLRDTSAAPVFGGQPPDPLYEGVMRRSLEPTPRSLDAYEERAKK
jgi:mono/diheme cytochrome c family protein